MPRLEKGLRRGVTERVLTAWVPAAWDAFPCGMGAMEVQPERPLTFASASCASEGLRSH